MKIKEWKRLVGTIFVVALTGAAIRAGSELLPLLYSFYSGLECCATFPVSAALCVLCGFAPWREMGF